LGRVCDRVSDKVYHQLPLQLVGVNPFNGSCYPKRSQRSAVRLVQAYISGATADRDRTNPAGT
jgi:hypothetical protein